MQDVTQTTSTVEVINQFNDAFNRHDVQAGMALMTEDCVFDNTYPPPDGERFEGQEAVRHFWEEFFRSSPDAVFQSEEMLAHGDRCVIRWRYEWTNTDGSRGHVRGVDVLRVRDGKVAEKLAYVKGVVRNMPAPLSLLMSSRRVSPLAQTCLGDTSAWQPSSARTIPRISFV